MKKIKTVAIIIVCVLIFIFFSIAWILTIGSFGGQRGFWADKEADTALKAVLRHFEKDDVIGTIGTEDVQIVLIDAPVLHSEEAHVICIPTYRTTRFFKTYYYYTTQWHVTPEKHVITEYHAYSIAGKKDQTLVCSFGPYDGTKTEVYFESIKADSGIFEYTAGNGSLVKFQLYYAVLEGDYTENRNIRVEVKQS